MLSRTSSLIFTSKSMDFRAPRVLKRGFCGSRKLNSSTSSKMFEHQSKLPKIPVPSLQDTLHRYVIGLEPLVSKEQLETTKRFVAEFESNPSWGPYLQSELLKLDTMSPTSYIEGFWDTMYLEIRDPIVTNVNPGFILARSQSSQHHLSELSSQLGTSLQIAQTAQLLEASARFVNLVKSELLAPDMEKSTPLDMSQYPKLFSATRIPGYSRDVFQHLPEKNATHVVVIAHGQYFKVEILDLQGQPLSVNQIASQLANVHAQASHHRLEKNSFYPLGPLTAQDRLNWSWNYAHLASLGNNRIALDQIEQALFAVCLEDSVPASVDEAGQTVLHGPSSSNRYYDKSIQLIVFQDGLTGVNFEHTGFDGHTVLSFVNAIHSHQSDINTCSKIASIQDAPRISFTLDEKLRRSIDAAKIDFAERAAGLSSSYVDWKTHGKKFITSHGLSPDAYVQMAFQLTQFRLFKKIVSTYESSNVKHFNHGRTECVRSATSDAKKFVETFDDTTKTPQDKLAALNSAVERHVVEMKKSKEGKLVDRHLQVLNWLSLQQVQRQAGYKRPTLFTDPSYAAHFASILSTSNCGSPALDHFSFGPVTASGFGLGYMIKDHNIPVSVTSFQGKAKMFADGLTKSLTDMHAFVNQHGNKKL